MNPFETNPHEINVDHLFVCDSCLETLNRYEAADPIVLEGKTFCDTCGSDLIFLRLEGYLKPIKERTELIVDTHNRKLDAALAEMIYPINSVRHI